MVGKMGLIEQPLSAIRVWDGYLEMAMDGPRLQEIIAKPRPICQRRKRPSFRTLIAAKDALFLGPFSAIL